MFLFIDFYNIAMSIYFDTKCLFLFSASEVDVVQQVVCWLIRRKAQVRIPGQASKYDSAISSQRISGKNSVNKPVMKKLLKKFVVRSLRSRIKLRRKTVILTEELYVCICTVFVMYVFANLNSFNELKLFVVEDNLKKNISSYSKQTVGVVSFVLQYSQCSNSVKI